MDGKFKGAKRTTPCKRWRVQKITNSFLRKNFKGFLDALLAKLEAITPERVVLAGLPRVCSPLSWNSVVLPSTIPVPTSPPSSKHAGKLMSLFQVGIEVKGVSGNRVFSDLKESDHKGEMPVRNACVY